MSKDGEYSDYRGLQAGSGPGEHCFEGQAVRSFLRDGDPWFVAADVCAALNLKPNKGAFTFHLAKLDEDERAEIDRALLPDRHSSLNLGVPSKVVPAGMPSVPMDGQDGPPSRSGGRTVWLVSESGLYTLILRSRDATRPGTLAHRFRRWVTREVLPSLRRANQSGATEPQPCEDLSGMKAPGRYLVTVAPGKPAHIQRMPPQSVVHHVASNDLEILALALRFIGSWWRRYQNTGAIRIGPTDGFCRDQLELAILNGQILGDEALQAMQEARSAQALTSVAGTGTAAGAAASR